MGRIKSSVGDDLTMNRLHPWQIITLTIPLEIRVIDWYVVLLAAWNVYSRFWNNLSHFSLHFLLLVG